MLKAIYCTLLTSWFDFRVFSAVVIPFRTSPHTAMRNVSYIVHYVSKSFCDSSLKSNYVFITFASCKLQKQLNDIFIVIHSITFVYIFLVF
jgi:hypothetical protein